MSWEQTLQDASFKGITFDVIATGDSFERATAEHSYPYVNGSDIEDMGAGAWRTNVQAIFYGADYEIRLQKFLDVLRQAGAGELIHPIFGSVKDVLALNPSVKHDAESPDQAMVTLDFVQSTASAPFFDRSLPSQKAAAVSQPGGTATASATEALGALVDRLRAAQPLAQLNALRTSMTGPLLAVSRLVPNVTGSGLDVLAYPRAWGNDVSAFVGGFVDARDFASTLSADWASIQSSFTLFDAFSAQPAYDVPQPVATATAPTEAQATAAAAVTVEVNAAVGLTNAASLVLASEAITPTMTPPQIEAITNTARSALESAITDVRAVYALEYSRLIAEPLKDQALALQEAARAIIEARPPLIRRAVKSPGNLRLVAFEFYGDHMRAEELLRLNNLRLPNFIQSGDALNAYAN